MPLHRANRHGAGLFRRGAASTRCYRGLGLTLGTPTGNAAGLHQIMAMLLCLLDALAHMSINAVGNLVRTGHHAGIFGDLGGITNTGHNACSRNSRIGITSLACQFGGMGSINNTGWINGSGNIQPLN